MNTPRIKVIFVDFGNVCVTFEFQRFLENFSTHAKVPIERVKRALFGKKSYSNLFAGFERGELSPVQFFHVLTGMLDCRSRIDYETFAHFWIDVFLKENEDLDALLHRLPQKKFLLSNTNKIAYGRYIAECSIVRRHFHSEDDRILSYRVGALKPDMQIYHHALARAGITSGETLFIDDIAENIVAWETLGGHGIVYNAHAHSTELENHMEQLGLFD